VTWREHFEPERNSSAPDHRLIPPDQRHMLVEARKPEIDENTFGGDGAKGARVFPVPIADHDYQDGCLIISCQSFLEQPACLGAPLAAVSLALMVEAPKGT
jgi:hypothetical protein